jgi:signal recognition particle subunit SRP54
MYGGRRRRPRAPGGAAPAGGSGRPVQEINQLMKQFQQMRKLMKQMRGRGLGGGRGMSALPNFG